MAKLHSDIDKAKDRLALAVLVCILGVGIPISYAAYSFWSNLDIPYCRSSEAGTAPAAVYRKKHQEHAKKIVVLLESSTGLTLLLSCVSLVLFLLPFLLTCENDGQYGRASLVSRALKASWLSLSLAAPVFAFGTYLAAVILFVYIPSVRGDSRVIEKRPNNSFKPKPLRGSA